MHFKSCVCACSNKFGILSPNERGLHVCMGISKWEVFQLAALKLRGLMQGLVVVNKMQLTKGCT